ncbi:MAG: transposase [Planctomycetes bacterium]|nr:transposase [Planctomycetota bacterium]
MFRRSSAPCARSWRSSTASRSACGSTSGFCSCSPKCASTPVDSTRQTRRSRSVVRGHRFGFRPSCSWPSHTGPNPTDRTTKGCKRHVITDTDGIPLVVKTTPANVCDDQPAVELVHGMPPIQGLCAAGLAASRTP